MKALFNYIKARINTDIPTIKTVRMFNNQMLHANGEKTKVKDEKFFPTPACFVEFIENEIDNRSLGIKDVILTVRFRFSRVDYKFERLETFDFVDQFDAFIQMMAPTVASQLTFTTFQEIQTEWDEDHNNVENPYRDYRTRYRRTSGYQWAGKVTATITGGATITATLQTGGNPILPSGLYIEPEDYSSLFTDSITITEATLQAAGHIGQLAQSDLGGKTQVVVSGVFTQSISVNGVAGKRGQLITIMPADASTVMGQSSNNTLHGISAVNSPNFIRWLGKKIGMPVRTKSGAGQSGLSWSPIATTTNKGSVIYIENYFSQDTGYAGQLMSIGILGREYRLINVTQSIFDGLVSEGEGGYYGDVNVDSPLRRIVVTHTIARNKGRESRQYRWGYDVRESNYTSRNVGRVTGQAGQTNHFQVQVSNGFSKNFVEVGAPTLENIITHGFTRQGGFTSYDGQFGYIGKANNFWPGDPRLNTTYVPGAKKIVIRDRVICSTIAVAYAYLIDETDCDIDFINIIYSDNHTNLFSDNRGTHSNVITVTNCVKVPLALIPQPTFISDDPTSPDYSKLAPTDPYYLLGYGFKTPPPTGANKEIYDCEWPLDIPSSSIPNGTSWATVLTLLPQIGRFQLQTGKWVNLAVVWAQGSYNPTTTGEVIVYGTPTLTTGIANTLSTQMEQYLNVAAPISSNKTVITNLGGVSIGFITGNNWNHVKQGSVGDQTIYGESTGEVLSTGFKKTDGTGQTTQRINLLSPGGQGEQVGQNTAGSGFNTPGSFNFDEISGFSSGGNVAFKFTGLTIGKSYTYDFILSAGNFLTNPQNMTPVISGAATGNGTQTVVNAFGNVNTFCTVTITPNASTADFTLTITGATGVIPRLSGFRVSFTEP